MIIKNVKNLLFSWKNTLLFRCKFWMIRTLEGVLEPVIISQRLE